MFLSFLNKIAAVGCPSQGMLPVAFVVAATDIGEKERIVLCSGQPHVHRFPGGGGNESSSRATVGVGLGVLNPTNHDLGDELNDDDGDADADAAETEEEAKLNESAERLMQLVGSGAPFLQRFL